MPRINYAMLVVRALWELLRYDVVHTARGFQHVCRQLERQPVIPQRTLDPAEKQVCDAVSLASCFYWKRVYCLQRSVAATRLLRQSGIHGRVVIGYRPSPFFSHAWVEVEGRVVNDSQGYRERMHVLATF
jgi:transglutaminase superfamily protein